MIQINGGSNLIEPPFFLLRTPLGDLRSLDSNQIHQSKKIIGSVRSDRHYEVVGEEEKQAQINTEEGCQNRIGFGQVMAEAEGDTG